MLIYNRTGADAAEKTMTYQENRLIGVSSSGSGASGSGSYDAIGRVVSSDIEGKTKVQYNVTGFPSYIGQADGGYVHSTYAGGVRLASRRTAADGRKLRLGRMVTEVGEMPFENPTDYVGNLVYKNGVLDKILVDGGYISGSDMNYRFFVTDHLGNVRVVVTAAGVIEQENEFYPYGESVDTGTQFTSDNPYKWGGKEWDEEQGAYDFGARMYSPTDACWTTMDPLCEKYYHISPYSYCAGNPVNLVDPDGRDWFYYSVDGVSDPTWNWRDEEEYHTGVYTEEGTEVVLSGAKAVAVFNGSRLEKLGKGDKINGVGAVTASVTLYGPDGANDISYLTGYTMTSDAKEYIPIAEGIYDCNYMDPGKGGKLPSHWALNNAGAVPTMDGLPNTSPYAGDNYDLPQKTGIYIHRTNRNGFAGATVSVGCLLLSPTSWTKFDSKVSGLESFKVQVVRSDCKLMDSNCFFGGSFVARFKRK